MDEVAEWLRRWTANPVDSVRVGSNPILVVDFAQKAFRFDYVILTKVGLSELKNLHYFILILHVFSKKSGSKIDHKRRRLRMCVDGFVIRFCR